MSPTLKYSYPQIYAQRTWDSEPAGHAVWAIYNRNVFPNLKTPFRIAERLSFVQKL